MFRSFLEHTCTMILFSNFLNCLALRVCTLLCVCVLCSAAVITAYLMRTEHLSLEDALESLRQSCEFVCPNDGFLEQLKLFEEMGFKVDYTTPIYRRFRLKILGDHFSVSGIDSSKLGADPENVVGHTPGEGETSFEYKRRSGNPFDNSNESECSSVFIEPLRWMKAVEEGALEGKLSCTQCDARLGYFNWTGIQCSCGSWITPAFQLHKGRVDISRV
ncbi:putative phosphoric monoester hydrolase [Lupinus albus]|uniref:protein-tyrosine-phosphatase n=1 Tax=Lupinus albus TaxID=3870 RepID=A0A6A4N4I5_LUPAL|nr:putative phosphoric monoester hydrolase [Lupinus albus]